MKLQIIGDRNYEDGTVTFRLMNEQERYLALVKQENYSVYHDHSVHFTGDKNDPAVITVDVAEEILQKFIWDTPVKTIGPSVHGGICETCRSDLKAVGRLMREGEHLQKCIGIFKEHGLGATPSSLPVKLGLLLDRMKRAEDQVAEMRAFMSRQGYAPSDYAGDIKED